MDRVATAFDAVPRAGFLPPDARRRAGFDSALPIGHGQTNSQPRTVADMLTLLAVTPGLRVLDVGAGSGWTTALLAWLVGPAGEVRGLELEPELVVWGAGNLGTTYPWARIDAADPDVLGDPEHAPYDRILVSADAPVLPGALVDQLGDPGRMVLPVRGVMTLVVRDGADPELSEHGHYRFVPLR